MSRNVTRADLKTAVRYRAYKVSALNYLALTSAVVTYPFGKDAITTVWPAAAPVLAIFVSLMIYKFVDGPLSNGLQYYEDTAGTTKGTKYARRRWRLNIAVAIVAAICTGGMSYVANYLLADRVAPMPDATTLQYGQQENNNDRQQRLTLLATDINNANKAIKEAERRGHKAVETAYCAYNPRWCERPKAHMNYALTLKGRGDLDGAFKVWYEGVIKAQQDSARTVADARQQLATLSNNKALLLADTATNAGLTRAFLRQQDRAQMTFSKFAGFLIFTDIAAVLFAWFCAWWLAQFKSDGGRMPEAEDTFQERLDEWAGQQKDKLLARMFGAKQQPATTPNKPGIPSQHFPNNSQQPVQPAQQLPPNAVPVSHTAAATDYTTQRRLEMLEARLDREREERERLEREREEAKAQQSQQQGQQQAATPVANRPQQKQQQSQQQRPVFELTVQEDDKGKPYVMYKGPRMSDPVPYYYEDARKQFKVYADRVQEAKNKDRKPTENNIKRMEFFKKMMEEIEKQQR